MLLLGVPSLVAAALALQLTETSKRKLPTTMEDAKNMALKKKKPSNNNNNNNEEKLDVEHIQDIPMAPVEGGMVA